MIFEVKVNGRLCRPNYDEDIAFETGRPEDEMYYRTTLKGALLFLDGCGDYSWIMSRPFDEIFVVEIHTEAVDWRGRFTKTDCEFDADNRSCKVTPETYDRYTEVLEHMDEKYDIIRLKPVSSEITLHKRPVIQTYVVSGANSPDSPGVGDKTVTNVLGGMTWEQPIRAKADSIGRNTLEKKYRFALTKSIGAYRIDLPQDSPYYHLNGTYTCGLALYQYDFRASDKIIFSGDNGYELVLFFESEPASDEDSQNIWWKAVGLRDVPGKKWAILDKVQWDNNQDIVSPIILETLRIKDIELKGRRLDLYMRTLADKYRSADNAKDVPAEDIVENNLNYKYVLYQGNTGFFTINKRTSKEPTEYGLSSDGRYFTSPPDNNSWRYLPLNRSMWETFSIWTAYMPGTAQNSSYSLYEENRISDFTLRNAYPIWSVMKRLLGKMSGQVTHEGTDDYSVFLYDKVTSPFRREGRRLFITPVTNIKKTYYNIPAKKGKLSLRDILDFMRDVYRVYWFIDDEGRFRLEHVVWFMKGGGYAVGDDNPIGMDVTEIHSPRHLNSWAHDTNKWGFNKLEMPESASFKWAEKSTGPFDGYKIEYESNYVKKGLHKKTNIGAFCTDVDYIISNPGAIGNDTWVAMEAEYDYVIAPECCRVNFLFNSELARGIGDTVLKLLSIPKDGRVFLIVDADSEVELTFFIQSSTSTLDFPQSLNSGENYIILPVGAFDTPVTISFWQKKGTTVPITILSAFSSDERRRVPEVPILELPTGISPSGNVRIQNGTLSFLFAVNRYYPFDRPCPGVYYNGERLHTIGLKKLRKQEVVFPLDEPLDTLKLVRTGLSDKTDPRDGGEISKMTYYPLSDYAKAELYHTTE